MTTKTRQIINEMALSTVRRIPSVMLCEMDGRELLTRKQFHRLVVAKWTRLFKRLERACDEMAVECEGKTAAEIREINKRKLDAIFGR